MIGWFQGRMEFGPRALGGRTIIGDARSPNPKNNQPLRLNIEKVFVLLLLQLEKKIYQSILILIGQALICS